MIGGSPALLTERTTSLLSSLGFSGCAGGGETKGAVEGPELTLGVVSGGCLEGAQDHLPSTCSAGPPRCPPDPGGPSLAARSHSEVQPPDGGRSVSILISACSAQMRLRSGCFWQCSGLVQGGGQSDACGEVPGRVGERLHAGIRPGCTPVHPEVWGATIPALAVELLGGDIFLGGGGRQTFLRQEVRAVHQALKCRHGGWGTGPLTVSLMIFFFLRGAAPKLHLGPVGQRAFGSLIGIALNLSVALGSIVILTTLILPIQEYSISFHLCPLQFFINIL